MRGNSFLINLQGDCDCKGSYHRESWLLYVCSFVSFYIIYVGLQYNVTDIILSLYCIFFRIFTILKIGIKFFFDMFFVKLSYFAFVNLNLLIYFLFIYNNLLQNIRPVFKLILIFLEFYFYFQKFRHSDSIIHL
jgi:hypothetical protein